MQIIDNPQTKGSPVWPYFGFYSENGQDIKDQSMVVCKICKTELVYKTGSTSNLRRHLERKHPHIKILDEKKSKVESKRGRCVVSAAASSSTGEPLPKKGKIQPTLKTLIDSSNVKPLTAKKENEITKSIGIFICKDLRPFSVVENEGFCQLLNCLESRYKVPCHTHFSEQVVPNLYDETKQRVMEELKEACSIALTTDGWTSRSTESYVTITAHAVIKFKMRSYVLQTRMLSESHTADNLASILNHAMVEWCLIKDGKKPNITTDNASNITSAVKKCEMLHVRCVAHTLNLATQKGLKIEGIVSVLKKVRRLVAFFHRSSTAAALLKSTQVGLKLPKNKLIQDVETRWNSSFNMLERYLEQRAAVSATLMLSELKFKDKDSTAISETDHEAIEDAVKLLAPMKTATKALSGEKHPTVSLIFPLVKRLLVHLESTDTDSDVVRDMKEAMHRDLSQRYTSPDARMFLMEASVLDPRFKSLPHAVEQEKEEVYESIRAKLTAALGSKVQVKQEKTATVTQEHPDQEPQLPQLPQLPAMPESETAEQEVEVTAEQEVEVTAEQEVEATAAQTDSANSSALEDLFGDVFVTRCETSTDRVVSELSGYRSEPVLGVKESPLKWWSDNCKKYPLLANFAKPYLATQATSVASERVFSTAGDIVTAQRATLSSDSVDRLIFLKKNL